MLLKAAALAGAYIVDIEAHVDERGFFARTFCSDEMSKLGLDANVAQCSVSFNRLAGTLRGMHWQADPYAESKLVRCTRGAIYDVIVDIRPASETFGGWLGVNLAAETHRALFVPKGFAHGFMTLEPEAEVLYQISTPFRPGYSRGFRWNDPRVGIKWPASPSAISARDDNFPTFQEIFTHSNDR